MSMNLSRRAVLGTLAAVGLNPALGRIPTPRQSLQSLVREKRVAHGLPGLAAAIVLGGRIAGVL